jgi:hypothetical protein
MRFRAQHMTVPDTESRRTAAQINNDVEDRPGSDPDELALGRCADLIVQPAQHVFGGTAVVVLDEIKIQPDVTEGVAVPGLEEKPARIAEDFRLEQPRIVDFGWAFFHGERGAKAWEVEVCGKVKGGKVKK